MASVDQEYASSWAMKASNCTEEHELAQAVGNGLAAVALALLDVADAIRESADK